MASILNEELDNIAREGFAELRAGLRAGGTKVNLSRGLASLSVVNASTKRMNAENNGIKTSLQTAKALGIAPEEQGFLWDAVKRQHGASAQVMTVKANVESAT